VKIFVSYHDRDSDFEKRLVDSLQKAGFQAYPKHLKGFFGASGLHDPDELDEYFRDEELAVIVLSKNYMTDRWLQGEIHALLTLENKWRPGFVLPIFLEGISNEDIPEECFIRPHVDFRGKSEEVGFSELMKIVREIASRPRLSVFVSHSSKDAQIAEALSDLLRSAFGLSSEEILCTSVGGFRLPLSSSVNETLRRKVREAKVFVCIATENSIGTAQKPGSFYVAVELGARWGMKRYLAILVAGAVGGAIGAPFSGLNFLRCDDHGQVQQFIRELGPMLGKAPESADRYSRAVNELVEVSKGLVAA
jgi:hypothetical protein